MKLFLIYSAVVLGVFFEGEMVLISSAVTARSYSFNIILVFLMGVLGAFFSDNFYFFLGRTQGTKWIDKRDNLKRQLKTVHKYFDKYPILLFASYRFLYGLRTVIPFMMGMGNIKSWHFFLLSAIATVTWSILFCSLGYVFGEIIQKKFIFIQNIEKYVLLFALVLAFFIFFYKKYNNRKIIASKDQNRSY